MPEAVGNTRVTISERCQSDRLGRSGEPASVKEALQALNDYIGDWKGNGTSEKDKGEI